MENGIYHDLPIGTYHANRTHLSSSALKKVRKSPAIYHHWLSTGSSEASEALSLGSLVHTILLEPNACADRYYLAEVDRITPAVKAQAAASGKELVKASEFIRAQSIASAVRSDPFANPLLSGQKEVSIFATLNGINLKCRCDIIDPEAGVIVDVKTSFDPLEHSFTRDARWKFDYDLSAALYTDIATAQYGKPFKFYFVVVGTGEIPLVCVYQLGDSSYQMGREKYTNAIDLIAQCEMDNFWPSQAPREL